MHSQTTRVTVALLGTLTILLLGGLVTAIQAAPGILYVAPGGNCGGGTPNCYASVQAAVDAASEGDEIRVATGSYIGVHSHPAPAGYSGASVINQVVYIDKTVTVRGGYATTDWTNSYPLTQTTTLDAQGQGRVIFITGDTIPVVEGLRVMGGDSAGMGGSAGMDAGGGIYIFNTPATITANQILGNTGRWVGGGLYLKSSNATISGNTITGNTADFGAGIYPGI